MSGPAIKVEIPDWNDAQIDTLAELLLRLVDDDGVIAGFDATSDGDAANTRRHVACRAD